MSASRALSIYTIPPGCPFLPTLADAIHDGRLTGAPLDDPLMIADVTILLPNRRSARAFREVLLARAGSRATLLPRIQPVGDVEEDDFLQDLASAGIDLPPAFSGLERHLVLAYLVEEWAKRVRDTQADAQAPTLVAASPADAVTLARALLQLLDGIEAEGVDVTELAELVPGELARHYELTLEFLQIVMRHWPHVLAERGVLDPTDRRNRMIDTLTDRVVRGLLPGPIIAAGSTGSIPATARLLAQVARAPQGAVVLPGLDCELDDDAFARLTRDPAPLTHPQVGLARLLARIGATRADVTTLEDGVARPRRRMRARLVSEAMRPAENTAAWRDLPARLDARDLAPALQGVTVVEAANEREEALVVALALRDAIQDPDATAALVTPDRTLARRVAAELTRWGIAIDDSAGQPLAATPPGVLARLVLDCLEQDFAPVPLLALLKHPLTLLGFEPDALRVRVRLLDLVLRGPRPQPGIEGLARAVDRARRLGETDRAVLTGLVERLGEAFAPLTALDGSARHPLQDLMRAHWQCIAALATGPQGIAFLETEAGEVLVSLFSEALEARVPEICILRGDYPGALDGLMCGCAVRPRTAHHARLSILGVLEARLLSADLFVLSGLNEGVWPELPETDPWLSRPMGISIGLVPPERRIGQMAHDFAQSFAARRVLVTRSLKSGGAPTVPSRWLQRIEAVLEAVGIKEPPWKARSDRLLRLARHGIDRAEYRPIVAPEPRPPLALRPRSLSVTQIEHWVRDPYGVYARHILRIAPLEPLDAAPDASDRGTIIHRVIARVMEEMRVWRADAAEARLIEIGRAEFARFDDRPEVQAVWWPRFLRAVRWFVVEETARRSEIRATIGETEGALDIEAPAGLFTLRARADRIDRHPDGTISILDYKTGTPPTVPQAASGLSPQLPLEGAIALHGGFAALGHRRARLRDLAVIRLTGGNPPGEWCLLRGTKQTAFDAESGSEKALEGLRDLVAGFDDPAQPYRPLLRPQWRLAYGDYDHLARVREWGLAEGSDG